MSTKKKPCIVTIYRNLSVEIDKPGAPVPYKIVDPTTKKVKHYSRKDAAVRGALRNLGAIRKQTEPKYDMGKIVSPIYLVWCSPNGRPIQFVFNKK